MTETHEKNNQDLTYDSANYHTINRRIDVKHCNFQVVEVQKDRLESIKDTVNAVGTNDICSFSSDIALSFSTTLLGTFLGTIPTIWTMITENKITVDIFFSFALLILAIVFFCIYLYKKQNDTTTIYALTKAIKKDIDCIFENLESSVNPLSENAPLNCIANQLSKTSQSTK